MKLLMLGDVVGSPGRRILRENLPRIRRELGVEAVVVNAENAAAGSGLTVPLAEEIFKAGVDAISLGDHTWGQKEFPGSIGRLANVVRPANLPPEAPGKGWTLVTTPICRFIVLNVLGRVFMGPVDCPFHAADAALRQMPKDVPVFVDFHAEATSEKLAMAYYLDGRVSAVWGTHTHVPTADEEIFPKGTGYVTDLGMTGAVRSVLGIRPEQSVETFLGGLPGRYCAPERGGCKMQGAIFTLDDATGLCTAVERVDIR